MNILSFLTTRRFRITRVRRALHELFSTDHHGLSVAQILAWFAEQNIPVDKSTLYRELDFFVHNHIITMTTLEGVSYFELASEHHHHLICSDCKHIDGIALPDHLTKETTLIRATKNFIVTDHSLTFWGKCQACQTKGLS